MLGFVEVLWFCSDYVQCVFHCGMVGFLNSFLKELISTLLKMSAYCKGPGFTLAGKDFL